MKMYTVNERTTEIKCRLDREEARELDCSTLEKKVDAKIEITMNGSPDDYFEYTSLEEALKKYEELKKSGMTYYSASCNLLYVYQVYIDEDEVDEDGRIDYGETIKFYTDSKIEWRA